MQFLITAGVTLYDVAPGTFDLHFWWLMMLSTFYRLIGHLDLFFSWSSLLRFQLVCLSLPLPFFFFLSSLKKKEQGFSSCSCSIQEITSRASDCLLANQFRPPCSCRWEIVTQGSEQEIKKQAFSWVWKLAREHTTQGDERRRWPRVWRHPGLHRHFLKRKTKAKTKNKPTVIEQTDRQNCSQ